LEINYLVLKEGKMIDSININDLKKDLHHRMRGAIDALHTEFSGLRTGRAFTSLLSPIIVQAYGANMPMDQLGTISAPEPRLLSIQVWDKELVNSALKAIIDSGLGLNPSNDGQTIRVPIPSLTEERRVELTKVAAKYAEESRIAIRNVRRHAMDSLKGAEKENQISQDQHHEYSDIVQVITDEFITKVDTSLENKNKEITQV